VSIYLQRAGRRRAPGRLTDDITDRARLRARTLHSSSLFCSKIQLPKRHAKQPRSNFRTTAEMSKQSKPGGAACAFAQTLGADILRQAREMDAAGPPGTRGCIQFGAQVGNRELGHADRTIVKRVYMSRVQKTGRDVTFVVEYGFLPYDLTRLEFATARAAIVCFALTVARIH